MKTSKHLFVGMLLAAFTFSGCMTKPVTSIENKTNKTLIVRDRRMANTSVKLSSKRTAYFGHAVALTVRDEKGDQWEYPLIDMFEGGLGYWCDWPFTMSFYPETRLRLAILPDRTIWVIKPNHARKIPENQKQPLGFPIHPSRTLPKTPPSVNGTR